MFGTRVRWHAARPVIGYPFQTIDLLRRRRVAVRSRVVDVRDARWSAVSLAYAISWIKILLHMDPTSEKIVIHIFNAHAHAHAIKTHTRPKRYAEDMIRNCTRALGA